MRHLLLCCGFLASLTANAQHLSVAATVGPDIWYHHPSAYQQTGYNLCFGEALSIRWDTRERISYEVTLTHNSYKEQHEYYADVYDGRFSHVFVRWNEKTHTYALASGFDVRLSKKPGSVINHFIGLELTPTLFYSSVGEESFDSATMQPDYAFQSKVSPTFYMWAGVHYSIRYRISHRLELVGAFALRVDPEALLSHDTYGGIYNIHHTRTTAGLGISYRLY